MKKHNIVAAILSVLTMVMLAMPTVQMQGRLFELKPLNGAVEERPYKSFTMRNYLSRSFQESVEGNLADHFGFREWLVRGYNQCQWALFRHWPHKDVVLGKDNWLFWVEDLNDYYEGLACYKMDDGQDCCDIYERDARTSYQLQEVLKDFDIHFFVCIAASKSHTYPEYVPPLTNGYHCGLESAYHYYAGTLPRMGVNCIDFNDYFAQIKGSTAYPLFYKFGSHWSQIAVANMGDTLMRYMERLGSRELPRLKVGQAYEAPPRGADNDLIELINLLYPIEKEQYIYANTKVTADGRTKRPRMLAVGDSFCEVVNDALPMDELFAHYQYWYYNHEIRAGGDGRQLVDDTDLLEELMTSDYIMLLWCPINLYEMGHTFVTKSLISLCIDDRRFAEVFDRMVGEILHDQGRMEQLRSEYGEATNQAIRQEVYAKIYADPADCFEELSGKEAPTCRNPRALAMSGARKLSAAEQRRLQIRHDIHRNPQWAWFVRTQADEQLISDEAAFENEVDWVLQHGTRQFE